MWISSQIFAFQHSRFNKLSPFQLNIDWNCAWGNIHIQQYKANTCNICISKILWKHTTITHEQQSVGWWYGAFRSPLGSTGELTSWTELMMLLDLAASGYELIRKRVVLLSWYATVFLKEGRQELQRLDVRGDYIRTPPHQVLISQVFREVFYHTKHMESLQNMMFY